MNCRKQKTSETGAFCRHPNSSGSGRVQDVRVVVACADFAAGRRAEVVLERVNQHFAGQGRLICSLWSFDFLAESVFRQQAAAEALGADIVVIAAHGEADFSEVIKDWVSLWVSQKEDRPKTLVCAFDWSRGATPGLKRIASQLKQVAQLGNMDFFSNREDQEMGTTLTWRGSAAAPGNACLNYP
jgi:hypothetical protein